MLDLAAAERVFVKALHKTPLPIVALRALHRAQLLLTLAYAGSIAELRSSGDPAVATQGKIAEQDVLLNMLQETVHLLRERWETVPERRRPHYTPEQRYRILRVKRLMAMSCAEAARTFCVATATIARWERESTGQPEKKTIGKLIRPNPPVRRYADVVRHVIQSMALLGFGGHRLIARTLARAGWKLSEGTVRNCRKEPTPAPAEGPSGDRGVTARHPGHVWMSDITHLKGLFGLTRFSIVSIFDVYSRMPLMTRTFDTIPSGGDLAEMFRHTAHLHGAPRHFISDQGKQYTSDDFEMTLRRLRVRHQFGAIGKKGSVAIIERFWLTLKTALGRFPFAQPLLWQDLDEALYYSLLHYAVHRPHATLGGATPAEIYFGRRRAHRTAQHPPRGRPGQSTPAPPFRMTHLDPGKRVPILVRAA